LSFDINGFLGVQINEIIHENYERHKELFLLCKEINMFAQSTKFKFDIHSEDMRGIILASLFIKVHNAFQGSVIMYKYGLDTEAKVITRTALESLFALKAVVKHENFHIQLVESDQKKREKTLKRIKENPRGVFDKLQNEVVLNELDKLISENKSKNIKVFEPKELAELSESYDDYYYAYNILCNDTHTDIRTMEKYLFIKDNDIIEAFNSIPSTKDIERVLFTANYVLLKALACMNEYCELQIDNDLSRFEEKMLMLSKKKGIENI
jgi:hypothetical protein